jgi:hypothetical protein
MSDKKKKAPATGEAESPLETYSNQASLMWRHDDIRIAFGQSIPSKGNPFVPKGPTQGAVQLQQVRLSLEERVAVTMSWAHAKFVHQLLGDAIKRFEDLNGEIRQNVVPPA